MTITLKELYENSYKIKLEALGRSPQYSADIKCSINKWERIIGNVPIESITDEVMNQFAVGLKKETHRGNPVSPCTVRKTMRDIRTLLNHAIKKDIIPKKPEIIMPGEKYRHAKDAFTFEEIQAILKATSIYAGQIINATQVIKADVWWKNLISFVYYTAVRVGTARAIRFDWIDGNTINIQDGEGVKTTYILPLHDEAIAIIKQMRELHSNDLVFPWPFGRTYMHKCFRLIVIAAGLPKSRWFGFHAIRKHTGSEMAKTDFAAAVKLLGHSTPNVTSQYYMNASQVCSDAIKKIKPLDDEQEGGTQP